MREWPLDALEHELESIRDWLLGFEECPNEVRIREAERMPRPSILIVPTRIQVRGVSKYFYEDVRNLRVTWWGSEKKKVDDADREAWTTADWLSRLFGRSTYQGPIVQIKDFSDDVEPTPLVDGWIYFETAAVDQRSDEYGLHMCVIDLRYAVQRGDDEELGPVVTGYTRKVNII